MATLAGMMLALTLAAGAADARPRIAFLALGPQQSVHLAFVDGLRRLGYAQGRDLDIDHRYGDVEKLKPLAQELIALKPDILVADSPSARSRSKASRRRCRSSASRSRMRASPISSRTMRGRAAT
jgi:ABC-type sugar transport system substrate-binding protein